MSQLELFRDAESRNGNLSRSVAANHILQVADSYQQDLDNLRLDGTLPETESRFQHVIRELRRSAQWILTGEDPGSGFSGSMEDGHDHD